MKGQVTLLMFGIDLLEAGAAIAAEDGAGQACRARLVGIGHGCVAVLLGLDGARPAVLDGIAHAAQQADARIAGIGEDHLLREPHADHLVVDDVGRHADQGQVLAALADRLMGGRMRDEMGETFERDDVAVAQVVGNSLLEALKLGHECFLIARQISKNTVSLSPCRWMSKV